tara:strand:- start:384 stop:866 length:483 start_codon:yes stop_codon:yes gene_type:complete
MNLCYKTVFFALIFLLSDIYLLFLINKKQVVNPLVESLDIEKKEIYNNIVEERSMIYFKSIFIGIFVSLTYYLVLPRNKFFKPKSLSKFFIASISLVILYLTIYFTYILHPKSDYMVLHLDTEQQRVEWIKVYKYMQFYYHLSFVLSFITLAILYYGLCG